MATTNVAQMCSYELPLTVSPPPAAQRGPESTASLPESLLVEIVLWFCKLRWLFIVVLTAFGILGFVPELFVYLGLQQRVGWPFAISGILVLINLAFLWHARQLRRSQASHGARINLWCQIILDLLVLTAVIHFVGSLETHVAFTYLFHIALACIFFSRPQSLMVVLIASALYVGCVKAETYGLVPSSSIYANTAFRRDMENSSGVVLVNVGSVVAIWLVVWYLTSHLSALVRQRDSDLAETNYRLAAAQEEKARHMLRTTHELKAPFAAIDANTQLLQKGHCGELPEKARKVIGRIAKRSQRLAVEIQEMLQLANLRSENADALHWVELDLAEVLRWCVSQVEALAQEREIVVESDDLTSVRIVSIEDHMKMLLANLLSNAVLYSHEGGRVRVQCRINTQDQPEVIVEDHGIGIHADKLPRIFDEYYRTDEAARHNNRSTGLGLAIVRQVTHTHGIRVRVESQIGVGTRFVLTFPAVTQLNAVREDEKGDKPCPMLW